MVTQTLEKAVGKAVEKAREIVEHEKQMARDLSARVEPHSAIIATALALGSIIASLALFLRKSKESAIFVGLWAPTILSLGLLYLLVGKRNRE